MSERCRLRALGRDAKCADDGRGVLEILAAIGEATAAASAGPLSGLASCRCSGHGVRYTVQSQQQATTARWMAELADEWDRRLARVKHPAEEA